jgi:hypothetical protein
MTTAAPDPLFDHLVSAVLRLVVPGEEPLDEVPSMRLVDDRAARIAVGADRGHVDDPRRAGGLGGVEDSGRGPDVGIPHRPALRLANPDPVAAGGMDEGVRRLEIPRQVGDIGEIALDELRTELGELGGASPVTDQRHHLVTAFEEGGHDPAADEAGATGDDDAPACRDVRGCRSRRFGRRFLGPVLCRGRRASRSPCPGQRPRARP